MQSIVVLSTIAILFMSAMARPSPSSLSAKVCDSREFLLLYQRTCIFYGKRARHSGISFHYGHVRISRDTSNDLDMIDPAPELARKCCENGCSVELIALHCNQV